jgi:arginyl-tRNA synthetase
MTLTQLATAQITKIINTSLEKLSLPAPPAFTVEIPADETHGDFATNAFLAGAKLFGMPPRKAAELALPLFAFEDTIFERAEIAGPGFVNFFLAKDFYAEAVKETLEKGNAFGKADKTGKSVLVEFVSANPTGPMHIGNARGGALGDALSSVLEFGGYDVKREFYVNDAGNQIEKFAASLYARYMQIENPAHEMPENAYMGDDITEHAQNFYNEHSKISESEKQKLVDFALPKNIEGLETDLEKYRISYDRWFRESEIYANGGADKVIEILIKNGNTYEKDGALWFKPKNSDDEADHFVLRRSNNLYTYIVPDIAYHYDKLVTRGFDIAVDVFGADHHGYIPRMQNALSALGLDPSRFHPVIMQMVRLVRDGQTIKASKRSGKAITLSTLLDEIPIDAARYFFCSREANTHLDFDLDLAAEQSSKNPVYYVQYAYARIQSILRQNTTTSGTADYTEQDELSLIKSIALFPDIIKECTDAFEPTKLTRYAYDLASKFHKFYNTCKVSDNFGRIELCKATATVLQNIGTLLKVEMPNEM